MNLELTDETFPKKGIATFLNPYSYYLLKDKEELLSEFDRIYCDGILFVLLAKLVGVSVRRVSFDKTSLAPIVFSYAEKNNLRIALVGGESGVVEQAISNFKCSHPNLIISYYHSGFFENSQHRSEIIDCIAKCSPDIVIVGMGAVLQEKFLVDLTKKGWRGYGYTCGGFLHQSASKSGNYYPKYINKFNLRWAYRIYKEPKLMKRYFLIYPKSVLFFIRNILFK